MLTNECRRNCAFCFARVGPWDDDYPPRPLVDEEIDEFLDADRGDGRLEIGVVGGEPLLHPGFASLVRRTWERGLTPKVFTSGTCPMSLSVADLTLDGPLNFVVNVAPWRSYTSAQQECLQRFFAKFGALCSLGFTLQDPAVDSSFLLAYREEFGLRPFLRIGSLVAFVPRRHGNEQTSSKS